MTMCSRTHIQKQKGIGLMSSEFFGEISELDTKQMLSINIDKPQNARFVSAKIQTFFHMAKKNNFLGGQIAVGERKMGEIIVPTFRFQFRKLVPRLWRLRGGRRRR